MFYAQFVNRWANIEDLKTFYPEFGQPIETTELPSQDELMEKLEYKKMKEYLELMYPYYYDRSGVSNDNEVKQLLNKLKTK